MGARARRAGRRVRLASDRAPSTGPAACCWPPAPGAEADRDPPEPSAHCAISADVCVAVSSRSARNAHCIQAGNQQDSSLRKRARPSAETTS